MFPEGMESELEEAAEVRHERDEKKARHRNHQGQKLRILSTLRL